MPGQCSVTEWQHLNTVLTFPGVRGHGGVAGVGAAALDHALGADPAEPGLGAPPPPPPHPAPPPAGPLRRGRRQRAGGAQEAVETLDTSSV